MGSSQLSIALRAAKDGSTDVDHYGTYPTRELAIEEGRSMKFGIDPHHSIAIELREWTNGSRISETIPKTS